MMRNGTTKSGLHRSFPAGLLLIPFLLWACSGEPTVGPELLTVSAAKPDGAGKGGKGGKKGDEDDGGGGDASSPAVDGAAMSGFIGDVVLYDAAGEWVTGRDDECGFVYVSTTSEKICLYDPSGPVTYPSGINASGLIAGTAYDAASPDPVPFVIQAADAGQAGAAVVLQIPPGWDEAYVSHWRPINAEGVVAGSLRRPLENPKKYTWEGALITWNPDGSIRAVSATTEVLSVRAGISDERADGSVIIGGDSDALGGPVVWDGTDGQSPLGLDDGGFRGVALRVVTPEGNLYGLSRGAIIEWSSPTSDPSLVVDLDTSSLEIDRNGNLLTAGSSGFYCVSRTDVTAVSRLSPLPDHERVIARAGDGGKVFGRSIDGAGNQAATMWDLTAADNGC